MLTARMTTRSWTRKREVCALVLHPSRMWLLTTVHRRLRVKISVVVVGPGDTLAEVNRSLATSMLMMLRHFWRWARVLST